ncbi:MAG: hypothetical protein EOM91_10140 [Sphingobacteriia bacterium]|jgi:thiol:disulfide interchange protein DsbG|nr:hypothetical protein [Sphingobacteriia bacterium]
MSSIRPLALRTAGVNSLRSAVAAALLGVSVVAGATATDTDAQTHPLDPSNPADALVQSQIDGYLSLVRRFQAPIGLTGYLLTSPSSQPVVVYSDTAGTHLFVGAIIDANGDNVALPQLSSYMEEHTLPALYTRMGNTAFVEQGEPDKPLLYVLFDPRCPHCAALHATLQQSIAEGRVAVRWIPVDVLGDEPLAARVLDERESFGAETMSRIFEPQWASDARAEDAPEPSEQSRTAASQNAEALALLANGGAGVPQMVYLARSGSFQIVQGDQTREELELIINSAAPFDPDAMQPAAGDVSEPPAAAQSGDDDADDA